MSPAAFRWVYRLTVVNLTFVVCSFISNFQEPRDMDFISYWAAGVMSLAGRAHEAYNLELHKAVEQTAAVVQGYMGFPYPPPFLFVVTPLGFLPFTIATVVWVTGTLALFEALARRLPSSAPWVAVAFPPVLCIAITGQNGFLTAALVIGGLFALPSRPFLGGLILGCLVIKPQLGVLLPLAFIAARDWRAFAGATVSSVGLCLAALAVFGLPAYEGFIALVSTTQMQVLTEGAAGWEKMTSVYAALRLAGAPSELAIPIHAAVAAAAIALLWRIWSRDTDLLNRGAALVTATALVSPYMYNYDMAPLFVAYCWLVARGIDRRLVVLLWLLPIASLALLIGGSWVNIAPAIPILLLALLYRATRPSPAVQPAMVTQPA